MNNHFVYLIARAEDDDCELFESDDYLPFFWLGLLDAATLAEAEPWWLELEQRERRATAGDYPELQRFHDGQPPLNLVLDRDSLRRNAARTANYLRQHAPTLLPLHQEFVSWLLAHLPGPDDVLHLDIVALAALTSTADYLSNLRTQLTALDAGQPQPVGPPLPTDPVQLTGCMGLSDALPADQYPLLYALVRPRRHPLVAPVRRSRTGCWWALLLGLLVALGLLALAGHAQPATPYAQLTKLVSQPGAMFVPDSW